MMSAIEIFILIEKKKKKNFFSFVYIDTLLVENEQKGFRYNWKAIANFCLLVNQRAVLLWTLDPAERDALLAYESTRKFTSNLWVLIEIACTRSTHDLFEVRKAYHARYKRSIEEDIAYHATGDYRKVTPLNSYVTID